MRYCYNLNYTNKYNNVVFNFRGHAGAEKFFNNELGSLIHETAFFREYTSDIFLRDYILKHKLNKNKIKIISLGCSTGEEVITQSMILDDIRDKVEILGIDISYDAINQANSRKYKFERLDKYASWLCQEHGVYQDAYQDSFLAFKDQQQKLSKEDEDKLCLFNKFFENNDTKSVSFFKRIIKKIIFNNYNDSNLVEKMMSLKEDKANNCKFQQGDILDINSYSHDKKADILLFRNTLYHFTTTYKKDNRVSKDNAKEIIENICKKLKRALTEDGIICFGKYEAGQLVLSENVVPNIMTKLGFTPLNTTNSKFANIWQIKK